LEGPGFKMPRMKFRGARDSRAQKGHMKKCESQRGPNDAVLKGKEPDRGSRGRGTGLIRRTKKDQRTTVVEGRKKKGVPHDGPPREKGKRRWGGKTNRVAKNGGAMACKQQKKINDHLRG